MSWDKVKPWVKVIGEVRGVSNEYRTLVSQCGETPFYDEYKKLLDEKGATYAELPTGLGKGDILLVVDMQNDFVPQNSLANPDGGKFGVAGGQNASFKICDLIEKASNVGAKIIATRDYHPNDHCSFNTNDGPFPPHCIQGHVGSFFYEPVRQALEKARKKTEVDIVFKGFYKGADTFGAAAYTEEAYNERHLGNEQGQKDPSAAECPVGTCAIDWTGSFVLKASNLEEDLNAPPDVMSVFDRVPMCELLKDSKRMFATGLALDFCVLDSIDNAKTLIDEVYLVSDAARAAHIPGIGTFGSGFLSPPEAILGKLQRGAKPAQLVMTEQLLK